MLKIETVATQLQSVRDSVSKVILADPNPHNWMYGSQLNEYNNSDDLALYIDHFHKLTSYIISADMKMQSVVKERFRFIEVDTMSQLLTAELNKDFHTQHAWRGLLNHTLLLSRSEAIAHKSLDAHLTTQDILRLPLARTVSTESIRTFLNNERERGNLVRGGVNQKTYWWAPSVSAITQWWIIRLSWHCVRTVMLARISRTKHMHYRSYWGSSLGMPLHIFDSAAEKDWSILTEPFIENGPDSGYPYQVGDNNLIELPHTEN